MLSWAARSGTKTKGNMRRFEDMVGGRPEVALLGFGLYWFWVFVLFDSGANASTAVSYTHLTLPTNSRV